MKKLCVVFALMLLLVGCTSQETLETVNDVLVQPVATQMQQVLVELPSDMATPVMETDAGKLYVCDQYTITQQVLASGDMAQTIQKISGFPREELKIMETTHGEVERYDFVWAATGESGTQICRACVLDDGAYHYVLTASADSAQADQLQQTWRDMFNSFRVVSAQMMTDTGS